MFCPIIRDACISSCVMREAEGGSVCIFLRAANAIAGIEEALQEISSALPGIDTNIRDISFSIDKK